MIGLTFAGLFGLAVFFVWWKSRFFRKDLTGKTVFVSGVSMGNIAHASAKEAVASGAARVVLTSYRAFGIDNVVAELKRMKPACRIELLVECDLTTESGTQRVFDAFFGDNGPADLMLLMHVLNIPRQVEESSTNELVAEMELLFRVNVLSYVRLLSRMAKQIEERCGRIVVVSSAAAMLPFPSRAAYGCSKAALSMFVAVLAQEHKNLVISCVHPGMVDTPPVYEEYDSSVVRANAMSADTLAKQIIHGCRNVVEFVPAFSVWMALVWYVLSPESFRNFSSKFVPPKKKEREST